MALITTVQAVLAAQTKVQLKQKIKYTYVCVYFQKWIGYCICMAEATIYTVKY